MHHFFLNKSIHHHNIQPTLITNMISIKLCSFVSLTLNMMDALVENRMCLSKLTRLPLSYKPSNH